MLHPVMVIAVVLIVPLMRIMDPVAVVPVASAFLLPAGGNFALFGQARGQVVTISAVAVVIVISVVIVIFLVMMIIFPLALFWLGLCGTHIEAQGDHGGEGN